MSMIQLMTNKLQYSLKYQALTDVSNGAPPWLNTRSPSHSLQFVDACRF